MQIDIQTGNLIIEEICVGPSLGFSKFEDSSLAGKAKQIVCNPPWVSFSIAPVQDGFGLVLSFYGESIDSISLMKHDPSFGSDWDNWSIEGEIKRRQFHDAWLKDQGIGPKQQFSWGCIDSGYDPKGAFSDICIRYARAT